MPTFKKPHQDPIEELKLEIAQLKREIRAIRNTGVSSISMHGQAGTNLGTIGLPVDAPHGAITHDEDQGTHWVFNKSHIPPQWEGVGIAQHAIYWATGPQTIASNVRTPIYYDIFTTRSPEIFSLTGSLSTPGNVPGINQPGVYFCGGITDWTAGNYQKNTWIETNNATFTFPAIQNTGLNETADEASPVNPFLITDPTVHMPWCITVVLTTSTGIRLYAYQNSGSNKNTCLQGATVFEGLFICKLGSTID